MKTIYTKWLALELRKMGFQIVATGINENFPQYNTYIFIDSVELRNAIKQLTNK